MASLDVLNGSRAGLSHSIAREAMIIGRGEQCELTLPEQTVSRQHARVYSIGDSYYIEDFGSRNGTFVNGQLICGPVQLHDNDQITIDTIALRFRTRALAEIMGEPATGNRQAGWAGPAGPGRLDRAAPYAGRRVVRLPLLQEEDRIDEPSEILAALDATSAVEERLHSNAEGKLRAILEITENLGRSVDVEETLGRITESVLEIYPQADQCFILLADGPQGELMPAAVKQRQVEAGPPLTMRPIARRVARQVVSEGKALLYANRHADAAARELIFELEDRSMMCAPLICHDEQPLGIIHVDCHNPQAHFRPDDLDVLVCVATLAAQAVEHASLCEQQLQLDRRTRDLETAQEVQLHLLPQKRPQLPGYSFFDFYKAADVVGGDYFGYIKLSDGRWAIAVGDVSGKGVAASLLMARLSSEVRYALATTTTLADAMQSLNWQLAEPLLPGRFITLVLCLLDPGDHSLTIVDAGHMSPLLFRPTASRGRFETGSAGDSVGPLIVDDVGPPLGIDVEFEYRQQRTELAPGDAVVLYTDGLSEAADQRGSLYGTERICSAVRNADADATRLGEALLEDVREFMKPRSLRDDACLLCFSRAGVPEKIADTPGEPEVETRRERQGSEQPHRAGWAG